MVFHSPLGSHSSNAAWDEVASPLLWVMIDFKLHQLPNSHALKPQLLCFPLFLSSSRPGERVRTGLRLIIHPSGIWRVKLCLITRRSREDATRQHCRHQQGLPGAAIGLPRGLNGSWAALISRASTLPTAVPLGANKTSNSRRDLTALAGSHLFRRGCEKEKIRRLWLLYCSDEVTNVIWGHWQCKDAGFGFKGRLDTKTGSNKGISFSKLAPQLKVHIIVYISSWGRKDLFHGVQGMPEANHTELSGQLGHAPWPQVRRQTSLYQILLRV